ncbi:MAG TPA: GAF and ANTAR domain-containing protein [Mycobacterium sp.]|jgi:GAF domain-containing protein
MGVDQPHERLAQVFGDLAVELQDLKATSDILQSIVEAARGIVPGTRWAGISLIPGKKVVPQVVSGRFVAELDQLQADFDEGPCLTTLREHHSVHIDDMRAETRWPAFAREAQQRGILSLLSFQLFVHSENLGALNLYGDQPGVFSEDSFLFGGILAQHAAVAMIGAAHQTQFEDALATRDVIGQAKGILMHRENLTGLQAFSLLTRASQHTNVKLVDVAHWLVDQHESGLDRS